MIGKYSKFLHDGRGLRINDGDLIYVDLDSIHGHSHLFRERDFQNTAYILGMVSYGFEFLLGGELANPSNPRRNTLGYTKIDIVVTGEDGLLQVFDNNLMNSLPGGVKSFDYYDGSGEKISFTVASNPRITNPFEGLTLDRMLVFPNWRKGKSQGVPICLSLVETERLLEHQYEWLTS